MFRSLATLACSLALSAALFVAAMHDHAASLSGNPESAACVYCSGGTVASPATEVVPVTERVWLARELAAPEAPTSRRLLPLAHSGNAPPA